MTGKDLAGYLRDLIAAGFGLFLLFGGNITQEQLAGILLFASTALAFGTYLYNAWQDKKARQGETLERTP